MSKPAAGRPSPHRAVVIAIARISACSARKACISPAMRIGILASTQPPPGERASSVTAHAAPPVPSSRRNQLAPSMISSVDHTRSERHDTSLAADDVWPRVPEAIAAARTVAISGRLGSWTIGNQRGTAVTRCFECCRPPRRGPDRWLGSASPSASRRRPAPVGPYPFAPGRAR